MSSSVGGCNKRGVCGPALGAHELVVAGVKLILYDGQVNRAMTDPILKSAHTPAAVVAVCGWSGSGKTTLLASVIPALVQSGLRVAVVKHCGHEPEADRPDKDSDRLFRTGADVVLESPRGTVCRQHGESSDDIRALVTRLGADHDVVFVEGHKSTALPKVWLAQPDDPRVPADVCDVRAVLPWNGARRAALHRVIEQELRAAAARRPLYTGILIGGGSTRMGRPKALLSYEGATFLEHVVGVARQHVQHICLLGSGPTPPLDPPPTCIPDAPGLSGPLAGVLAALRWAPGTCWLVLACDLPQLQPAALDWLIHQRAPGRWAVLPKVDAERVEPLLALYEPQALGLLETLAARGVTALRSLAGEHSVHTPPVPNELRASWTNVNTPNELNQLRGPDSI